VVVGSLVIPVAITWLVLRSRALNRQASPREL
jgi:hypothetical protein